MNNIDKFKPPVEKPQKLTRTRLEYTLGELDLNCRIEDEGNNFKIIIALPEEHINEKIELMKNAVLSDEYRTKFDQKKIYPLIRTIKRSINFDCRIEGTNREYIVTVYKK